MNAEILCIGSELLLGNITNGNARWLAEQLAALGIPHHRQQVVGDNRERVMGAVRAAAGRSQVLITTGGLGPTPDDLTTEAIAAAFGTSLEERPEIWADIQAKLSSNGRPCAASNRKQALLPKGAQILPNPTGTAPGMIWSPPASPGLQAGFTLLTFPGVPSEMRAMWQATAAPWLRESGLAQGIFFSRMLRFWGVSESALAEQMADLLALPNPTVAPYASAGEVKLRVTAKASSELAAQALLQPVVAEIQRRTGLACFGSDEAGSDETGLAEVVLAQLRHRSETLAVAESCTGGGLGATLVGVPGASDVFLGGVIAYANSLKQGLLGVSADLLERHGAVSDQVAIAMAEGVRRVTGATWAIAVTGVAGPGGGSPEKPVGTVHIGLAGPRGSSSGLVGFGQSQGRSLIQALTVGESLNRLRLQLF